MIVPFVFSMEVFGEYDHLVPFYKYLDMAKRQGWPMIAHERYFQSLQAMERLGFDAQWFSIARETFVFEPPSQADLDSVVPYRIPEAFERALVSQFPSQLDAWMFLLQEEHPPFTEMLEAMLDDMQARFDEPVEAFLCFYSPASLKAVAARRGIPILHQQGSALRPPAYREMYIYMDRKNMYDYGELEARYRAFQEETRENPVPLLSRKGLLKLFMAPHYLRDLNLIHQAPAYEAGLLLAPGTSGASLQYGAMTNEELRLRARRRFAPGRILERERPGFAYRGTDLSPTSFHFACQCKRVAANASNGLLEAMLVGRTACAYGHAYYSFMADKGLEEARDSVAPLDFLNFVIFAYYLPETWMTDVDYLRFRLSNPSERAIYLRGYDHALRRVAPQDLPLYTQEAPYAYPLGKTLYFTQAGDYTALLYFNGGLSNPEEAFTWSSGDETTATFDVGPVQQDLCLRVGIARAYMEGRREQLVSLFVNDRYVTTALVRKRARRFSLVIPRSFCQEGPLRLRLRYANPQVPPGGERCLTVAYQRVSLSAISAPPGAESQRIRKPMQREEFL